MKSVVFLAIAVVLLIVAGGIFGSADQFHTHSGAGVASNSAAGLTSLGFALAGGMSLIAAALNRPK